VISWDERFIELAAHVAEWSKDPSTQVGCVIARPDRTVASVGYNGFPRGVIDSERRLADRNFKLAMVVHAEANAVLSAYERLDGCMAYVSCHPCSACAGVLIQSGIARVVAPIPPDDKMKRWGESFGFAQLMFDEAAVKLDLL
jgi:dCMP deaminase